MALYQTEGSHLDLHKYRCPPGILAIHCMVKEQVNIETVAAKVLTILTK